MSEEMSGKTMSSVLNQEIIPLETQKRSPLTKRSLFIYSLIFTLLLSSIAAFAKFEYKDVDMLEAVQKLIATAWDMMHINLQNYSLKAVLRGILESLCMAFMCTIIGLVFGVFFGILSSRKLSNIYLCSFISSTVAFIRAVPTVVWVLVFAVTYGLGATAAIVGMSFHSAGYLIKACAECFDDLDDGVIESMKALGANFPQIIIQGVLPETKGQILAWSFFRFELNFGVAIAMGAVAGAGGIGEQLYMSGTMLMNVNEIGFFLLLILIVVIIMEEICMRLRKKIN